MGLMVLDWWWAGICYTRPCPRGGFGEEGGQSGLLQHLWANPEFPTGRKEEEDLLISREWSPSRDGPTAAHVDPLGALLPFRPLPEVRVLMNLTQGCLRLRG